MANQHRFYKIFLFLPYITHPLIKIKKYGLFKI
jgi:hypothetical protein